MTPGATHDSIWVWPGLLILVLILIPFCVAIIFVFALVRPFLAQRWRLWREAVLRRTARRASWRRLRGVRGMRGRHAWALLVRARNAGNSLAADLVWQSWLAAPDDEGWAYLSRGRPEAALADLLAAAAAAATDAGHRAALGAFCARHGLAPDDPFERVKFCALAGQPEQRRALDPDGALLATVYRAAGPEVRSALRESLAGEGDLDVVRIVVAGAGPRSRAADMTAAERAYLVGRVAGSRDWAGLWELAKDLPAAEAAGAVTLIEAGWRPDRQRDRDLYALVSKLSPEAVADARGALCADGASRIEVPGPVVAGALSPDGHRLAVAMRENDQSPFATVLIYRLPGGSLAGACRVPARDRTELLYTTRKKLIAVDSAFSAPGQPNSTRMYRCPDVGRAELVAHGDSGTAALASRRQGFAAVTADGYLEFHDGDGARLASGRLRLPPYPGPEAFSRMRAAADPPRGRIVVTSAANLIVVARAQRPREAHILTWNHRPQSVTGICLHGPSHVIVAIHQRMERWQFDGFHQPWLARRPQLNLVTTEAVAGTRDLIMINARDELCVLDDSGAVCYLDAGSLRPAGRAHELSGRTGSRLWASADGITHALAGDGFADVLTRELADLQALADRPQAAWRPSDLVTALRAVPVIERCPAARPLYTLIAGCLEHRFAGDVRLGRFQAGVAPDFARDDDIAIGELPGEDGVPGAVPGPGRVAGMPANPPLEARS